MAPYAGHRPLQSLLDVKDAKHDSARGGGGVPPFTDLRSVQSAGGGDGLQAP
ncbi:hypothetical protein QJS66_02900 [Kocuria rhizophila]|nr:hypothetical protein QJS66_02900 [Kocuria rhizophila]